jgi:hypothetical protein
MKRGKTLNSLLVFKYTPRSFNIIMDAVEDYARRWIKREVDQDPELESLSDWVRTIRSLDVNILQCFFVVENFTANAVSVAIGDNGNKFIFEI